MKLISPFKDYYDHAVHPLYIDGNIRYVRKTSIVDLDYTGSLEGLRFENNLDYTLKYEDKNGKHTVNHEIHSGVLIVGSKVYQVILPFNFTNDEKHFYPQVNGVILPPWGAPSPHIYEKAYKEYSDKENLVMSLDVRDRYYNYIFHEYQKFIPVPWGQVEFDSTDICLHYETPVLLIACVGERKRGYNYDYKRKVILNPPLKAFNIHQVLDPYQAWQEISMWIGGIMPGGCSPMVEITNVSKIKKAGFDPKWSFRKRPENME